MRRKVVQQGTSTMMVSLPSQWVKSHGIDKGDEIEMRTEGEKLLILPTGAPPPRKTTLDLKNTSSELQGTILRMLVALYKAGYDEIKILYEDQKVLLAVQHALKTELSEYEVVEQTSSYCVLQDISSVKSESFEPVLRRTFFLLLQMAEESFKAIESKQYDLQPLRYLEESNNRFTTFCSRLLSYEGGHRAQFLYHILEMLENIADQFKYLFDYLMAQKPKVTPDALAQYKATVAMLRAYYDYFYTGNEERLAYISRTRKRVVEHSLEIFQKDPLLLHYVIVISQQVFELTEPTIAMRNV
jgi:hypothetical protein